MPLVVSVTPLSILLLTALGDGVYEDVDRSPLSKGGHSDSGYVDGRRPFCFRFADNLVFADEMLYNPARTACTDKLVWSSYSSGN